MEQFQNAHDKQIYDYLCNEDPMMEQGQIKSMNPGASFLTHVIFKGLAIAFFYLYAVFAALLTDMITMELIIIFVVVDFWFTKNFNGRKMLGLRWQFGDDEYGVERFKFECRINPQYVNAISSKLFWLVQLGYMVVPSINLVTIIIIAPNIYRIVLKDVVLNITMFVGGLSNLFFFWKASAASAQRQVQLKKIYGSDFLRKMSESTIVSYL